MPYLYNVLGKKLNQYIKKGGISMTDRRRGGFWDGDDTSLLFFFLLLVILFGGFGHKY